MTTKEQKKVLFMTLLGGILCLLIVVMTSYAAQLQVENNQLAKNIDSMQGQVDLLDIKIKSATNVSTIETKAVSELGMVYPTTDSMIYVTDGDAPSGDFATVVKEKAYS